MKTQIWSLPDNVMQDFIDTAQERVNRGFSQDQRAIQWNIDLQKAIQEHGTLDPLFNPQLQGELF